MKVLYIIFCFVCLWFVKLLSSEIREKIKFVISLTSILDIRIFFLSS